MKNNIVGLFCVGPNPAACLVQEGRLVAMAEEERFRRNKDIELYMPFQAMQYCLREGGIELKDIDLIAYAWDTQIYRGQIFFSKLWKWIAHNRYIDVKNIRLDEFIARFIFTLLEIQFHHPSVIRQMLRNYWDTVSNDLPIPEVRFVPHHLAHAASTYYASSFDKATILTMDRNGEETSSAVWLAEGTNIDLVEKIDLPHSLGWFYAGFTDYLGFIPEYQEGKVMGLSAHGELDDSLLHKMNEILKLHPDGSYSLDPTFFYYGSGNGYAYSEKMAKLFGPPRRNKQKENIESTYRDIAFAVQTQLENAVLNLAQRSIQQTHVSNLCLSGGVALNCVANGKLLQSKSVNQIYEPPHCNDAGTAVGAALWAAKEQGFDPRFELEHANWGPGYSDESICSELDRWGIAYHRYPEIEKVVAQNLSKGRVIAWFQGRMEMGPRALGARSILADPRNNETHFRLNRIKKREMWRPLAPAILEEFINDFLVNGQPSPFMTIAFPVNLDKREIIPAVVHVDGTTRPQTVSKNNCHLRYYNLIWEFYKLTGVPVIVNTSFNVQEPIVCSIQDAIKTFYASEIEELAIGPALISKSEPRQKNE